MTASSYTDKGVSAAGNQLLNCDSRRGTSDTGGTNGHGLAADLSVPDAVFAVGGDVVGLIKISRDLLASTGVAGKYAIFTDLIGGNVYVILFFMRR